MFGDTERPAGAVPPAGLRAGQDWLSEALKLSEPPPVFETFTVCAAGFAPPCVALNARLVGATDRTGVAGLTVRVTSTVFGEPEAPAAVTVIGVVYVPGASPAIEGVTVTVAGAV